MIIGYWDPWGSGLNTSPLPDAKYILQSLRHPTQFLIRHGPQNAVVHQPECGVQNTKKIFISRILHVSPSTLALKWIDPSSSIGKRA